MTSTTWTSRTSWPRGRAAAPPCRGSGRCGLSGRGWGGRIVLPETELVPSGVLAGGEPAHVRHRSRLSGLAAELPHARGTSVDVVHVEVRAYPMLAGLHVADRGAGLVADSGHVVFERSRVRLELPPEERAPELAPLRGVVRRNLNVNRLAGHDSSSRSDR